MSGLFRTSPRYTLGSKIKYTRCVLAAQQSGLLERRGAKAELARILGVSRQYVNRLLKEIEAEGTVDDKVEAEYGS